MSEADKTVLVVEDDQAIREIVFAVLDGAGYRVLEAASGDEAHRLLLAHPDLQIDVLFTDVVMPGQLDGVELASRARALRPGLQVLFTTGFAGLARSDRSRPIDGPVLQKPYRPAELRRALTALFARVE